MRTRTTSRLLRIMVSNMVRTIGTFAMCASAGICAQMQVEEPPEPGGGGVNTFLVTTPRFSFTGIGDIPPCSVGSTEVGKCQFLNSSGVDWSTLTLSIDPGDEPVFCAALFGFDACTSTQGTASIPTVLSFSGGVGIPQGEILFFSGSGWPTLTTFDVAVNGVPEPGSIALMVSGIAAFGLFRRRRRS